MYGRFLLNSHILADAYLQKQNKCELDTSPANKFAGKTGKNNKFVVLTFCQQNNKVIGTRGLGVGVWCPRELTTEHLTEPSLGLD